MIKSLGSVGAMAGSAEVLMGDEHGFGLKCPDMKASTFVTLKLFLTKKPYCLVRVHRFSSYTLLIVEKLGTSRIRTIALKFSSTAWIIGPMENGALPSAMPSRVLCHFCSRGMLVAVGKTSRKRLSFESQEVKLVLQRVVPAFGSSRDGFTSA